ncbi:MAG TPA: type II toxin-antitoxin system RelE/ParE family toxin [Salinimicrobium catena]|uniref:Type II toxin-antitoxin system RelE/ParE family toxin n=1 Tax=Salinimicrobium catena TaxID=390640 RepID=A0A7C2M9X3_9FLAO|nr:type II toxin-antitoxin system RelE/ParE family toxin [Salinimicrobium catena]
MGHSEEKAPEAYSLRISDNALQNIDDITGYIAYIKHQPLTAIRVGDKIFQTIDHIEKNPLAFRECWEIPTKTKIYRQAVCMSWLIIYKVKAFQIDILGIIHTSRKPSRIRSLRKIK